VGRREVGVLRDSRSTSLLRLIGVGASRERHHCASADVGTIVCVSVYTIVIGVVLASWPLKTKLGAASSDRCFLVSAGRLPPVGDTSFSSEPPGGHVVAGNRLDSRKTLQLRRRSVALHRDRRRAARHHALLGGRRRQWTRADTLKHEERTNRRSLSTIALREGLPF